MIKLINISKKFNKNEVLKDISLEIDKGDLVYIKGSNGCGKSTLLKIIAGLLEVDHGKIEIDNEVIGALIENPSFIENETALFNLEFLFNLKNKFDKRYVKKYFDYLRLDMNNDLPMKKYSIGMRQKIGIIQAVMENQSLILLDEPSRGLDEDSICGFFDMIEELSREGKTIIICAHDGVNGIKFTKNFKLENGKIQKIL